MTRRRHGAWPTLVAFMRKEVRHLLRDRQTLAILLLLPLAQVVLFGYAVRTDIDNVRVAIVRASRVHNVPVKGSKPSCPVIILIT